LCVVADLRRTGVNIPSILTIQTNRLPYSLNLFGIKEKVESFYKFESVKLLECHLSTSCHTLISFYYLLFEKKKKISAQGTMA
jgi:hypothetical protein